jgi:hypothetical protein
MKSKITNYLMAFTAVLFFSSLSFAQIEDGGNGNGPDPCPSNFPVTETFYFTNSSNMNEYGSIIDEGCDYQVCVKIKPKLSCFPNCNYASPDGYWSSSCTIISVGQTQCISIPSTSAPITDCWDVDVTLKVVGHSQTLISPVPQIGYVNGVAYPDHCSGNGYTVIKRITGGAGNYNFNFFLRRFTGM